MSYFPNKNDSKSEFIRKIFFLCSLAVVIVCVIIIICDFAFNRKSKNLKDAAFEGQILLSEDKLFEIRQEKPDILDKYVELYSENPDIVGWIRVDDTPIDYPVMQSKDNDYYLYRDFDRKDTKLGSIFADFGVSFTSATHPANTVLYGHNINNGTQFAKLTNYYPKKYGSLNFYKTHPTVTFDTIYKEGTYKIFAGIFTNTRKQDGEVFDYHQVLNFKNKNKFYDYITKIMDRSVFYTDVDLKYGDELLTLSTCYYPLGDALDTRFVVFARKVRDGESAEVDTSKAYINPSPLYFDYYYRVLGGSWAGRNWDLSKIDGLENYIGL